MGACPYGPLIAWIKHSLDLGQKWRAPKRRFGRPPTHPARFGYAEKT